MNPLAHETLIELNSRLEKANPPSYISGLNWFYESQDEEMRVNSIQLATVGLLGLLNRLLYQDMRVEASLMLWGPNMFDPRARSARLIRGAVDGSNKVLVIGGAGTGKTWPAAAEIVLDIAEDPGNTFIKVISSTSGHAKNNILAKIFRFHDESVIKLPGYPKATSLIYKGAEIISQISIPDGDTGKGRLTGFHPMPRTKPHPKFGTKTRVKAYVDEADTVPSGLWEGLDNMLSSEDEQGSVQVVALTNPRDKTNSFAARSEPVGGFSVIDPDKDDGWVSRDGWTVVRLDPAKSENVVQQKEVYPGMMTYQGYQNYVRKGKGNPDYWIMGRGWYPEQAAEFIVVPPYFFDKAIGLYTFVGDVTPIVSLDPAFALGGDDPMLTAAKTGTAIGFTPSGGETIMFPRPLKNVVQIEQQFSVRKSDDPSIMGRQVIEICTALNARPEFFVMDRTGNALGLYGWLSNQFGSIMGIEWGSAATEQKILDEDSKNAYERYDGISTEMYFAFGHWLQYGQVKFAPICATYHAITKQVSGRHYYFHRNLQKLEDKASFKARNEGKSPDEGDSCVMAVHLVRVRKSQNPAMLPDSKMAELRREGKFWGKIQGGATDKMEFVDIN